MYAKKIVYYISFLILFLVVFIFLNNIVAMFIDNNVIEVKEPIEAYKNDQVYYYIDEINFHNDEYGSFSIVGWSFCETTLDNSQKEIWAVLSSNENSYKIKLELVFRNDVSRAFSGYSIKGNFHGFISTISTVGMKSGNYNLSIYCRENSENFGLVNTGVAIRKEGRTVNQAMWESLETNAFSPERSQDVEFYIDTVSIIDENHLRISGWTFLTGHDTSDQTVYVQVSDLKGNTKAYSTLSVFRDDVGNAYKDKKYSNSGFEAIIPIEKFYDGDLLIEVIIKKDQNVYTSPNVLKFSKPDV